MPEDQFSYPQPAIGSFCVAEPQVNVLKIKPLNTYITPDKKHVVIVAEIITEENTNGSRS